MDDPLLAADQLPCGLVAVGDDGGIRAANRELTDWLGRDASQLRGQNIDVLFTSAGRLLYHSYVYPLLKLHGRVDEIELSLQGENGKRIDVLLSAQRNLEADAGLIRCVFHRVRERQRLEDQLLNLRLAAQYLPGVMFQLLETDAGEQSVPFASEKAREFFGVGSTELQANAKPLWHSVPADDLASLHASRRQSADTGSEWRCKFRVIREQPPRIRWLEIHAAPQRRPDDSTLWHGYIADVTEHHEREQALIEKESAQRSSRAKSEFLARISHELRTPLNSVLGFSRLLELELHDTLQPDQLRKLQSIESSGRDLLFLINEILDISRIEAGHMQLDIDAIALQPLFEKLQQQFSPVAMDADISLHVQPTGKLAVTADPQRLQQVLSNLISNAIKYSPRHCDISIRTQERGDCVRIEVEDQGRGLDRAQISALFQPFNRLGAERSGVEGTGLGLVITRALIEKMRGTIAVTSEPGRGSCFAVELPRAKYAFAQKPEAPLPTPAKESASGVHHVLCVEDNPVNVLLMQSLFGLRPTYRLSMAPDAATALRMIGAETPELLLIDMNLPDATGTELLTAIRTLQNAREIPAVAVSADAMPEDIRAALRHGFCDYWTKPLNIDQTLQALDRLLSEPVGQPCHTLNQSTN